MKKNLKFKLVIAAILLIALIFLVGGNVKAANIEKILINPAYENEFSKEEKEIITKELEDTKNNSKDSKKRARTYNDVIYTENNYNDLMKVMQNAFVSRNGTITIMYKCSKRDDSILDKIIEDAMSEQYANSNNKAGDYIKYSFKAYRSDASININPTSSEAIYHITYTITYFTTYTQEQELDNAISAYLATYNASTKTKYQMILDFNNYICDNAEYDYDNLNDPNHFLKFTAYAALINHKAVCQGYATLYYRLLKECGIDNRVVISNEICHAWNVVNYLNKWYYVDTTWNDQTFRTMYFMKSVSDFTDHGSLTDVNPAIKDYPMSNTSLDLNQASKITQQEEIQIAARNEEQNRLENYINPVSGIKVTRTTSTEISLTWDRMANATHYEVYRYYNGKYSLVTTTSNTYYTDKNLWTGQGYTYKIIAINKNKGISSVPTYKNTFTNPAKQSGVFASKQNSSSIKLMWNQMRGTTEYRIYKYDAKKKKYVEIARNKGIGKNYYTDKKLKAGTTYKYKVRAYRTQDGETKAGDYSSVFTTTTATKNTKIKKISTKKKKVTLKWNKISQATGYEVYMSTNKKSKYKRIKTIKKNKTVSYTTSKLKKGKKYYFKVRTYRTVNGKKVYSGYTSVKNIKVK